MEKDQIKCIGGLSEFVNKDLVTRHIKGDGSFEDVKDGKVIFSMSKKEISKKEISKYVDNLIKWANGTYI